MVEVVGQKADRLVPRSGRASVFQQSAHSHQEFPPPTKPGAALPTQDVQMRVNAGNRVSLVHSLIKG